MKQPIPDFAWYSAESKRLGLTSPRCPFANVNACLRKHVADDLPHLNASPDKYAAELKERAEGYLPFRLCGLQPIGYKKREHRQPQTSSS